MSDDVKWARTGLIATIIGGEAEDECIAANSKLDGVHSHQHYENLLFEEEFDLAATQNQRSPCPLSEPHVADTILRTDHPEVCEDRVLEICASSQVLGAQTTSGKASKGPRLDVGGLEVPMKKISRGKRTKSSPPGASRSVVSGPWSLEWLYDQNHGDVGTRDENIRETVSKRMSDDMSE
ncbi:hypothetical protein TSUD_220770 [Trifolium subterraneum]|uniref:DUF4283 domain-containing protein n=1 Tax=Trifolium subterraneum TaxID=3900 RepID=A0A2Z6N1Q1_TRISU|nr:hypothetical protein TSUD_220770 [Trifolium subterraneum]